MKSILAVFLTMSILGNSLAVRVSSRTLEEKRPSYALGWRSLSKEHATHTQNGYRELYAKTWGNGNNGRRGGFNFEAISNASAEKSITSGSTMAIGNGKTAISSSIGEGGAVNNIEAENGGQSQSCFGQAKDSSASQAVERRDSRGNSERVSVASNNRYQMQGANQNAFAGQGASLVGIGHKGVVANVYGSEGAANQNAFEKQAENERSAQSSRKGWNAPRRRRRPVQEDCDEYGSSQDQEN